MTADFDLLKKALDAENIPCRRDVALRDYTSFRIGGPARVFLPVTDGRQLCAALKLLKKAAIPTFILGRGSNLLVSDSGYEGAVIYMCAGFDCVTGLGESGLRAGAGATLAALCKAAAERALTGLEFAYGIPGSVGGAAVMNAGAYGGEMSQVVSSVSYIDENGEAGIITADKLDFSYRHSVFSGGGRVITSVDFALAKGERSEIEAKMRELLARRTEKQPLNFPSAGSTFLRPEGHFAGALIEQAGLKGARIGGAQVSEKHAGFVINTGGASADDVMKLVAHIKRKVFESSGVTLQCEIKTLGF